MQKIIVPLDFSKHSEYALETAASLAKEHGAELLALHMLELSRDRLTDSDDEQNAKMVFFLEMAKKRFNEFLERDYLKDVKVIPMVKHFKVFSEVSKVAEDHSADLIVMGSHGTSGLSELFVGSNTERVVRHSDIPVLVIKSQPTTSGYATGLFACDFTEEMIAPFNKALGFFSKNSIKMNLVYVNTPGGQFKSSDEISQRVKTFFAKASGDMTEDDIHYISDYSVEKGVFKFAEKINADLIAIPTHGRTGLSHFFSGSITEDIANHANRPVLTIKI